MRNHQAGAPNSEALQEAHQVHCRPPPAGRRQGDVLLRKRLIPDHPKNLKERYLPPACAGNCDDRRHALAQGAAGVAERPEDHPKGNRLPDLR